MSNPAPGGGDSGRPNLSAQITIGTAAKIFTGGIVNAASYTNGAVSPGELVTISNIGPVTPAPMNVTGGYVDSSLSGISVTIDCKSAPLVYISQNQVTVQVPYKVSLGANKTVTVTNGANPPAIQTVAIQAAAPGIFTAAGSGSGQAAAVNFSVANQHYSLNVRLLRSRSAIWCCSI